jgi:hypothetical protein
MVAAYAAAPVTGEVVLTRLGPTTKDGLLLPLATGCQLALVCFVPAPRTPAALTFHSAGLMFTQRAFIAAGGAAAEVVEPSTVLTAAGVFRIATVLVLGGTLRRSRAAARG